MYQSLRCTHVPDLVNVLFNSISTLTGRLVQGALWQRKGWKEMDKMRAQLEDLRELRDLVRSLGRGGGWSNIWYEAMGSCELHAGQDSTAFVRSMVLELRAPQQTVWQQYLPEIRCLSELSSAS